jgi:integrase/recombinase XerD
MADGLSQRLACSLVRDQKQAISSLRRRMIEDMTIRKLAPETQQGDIRTIKDLERSSTDRLTRQASRTCGAFRCVWPRMAPIYRFSIIPWPRYGFFFRVTLKRYEIVEHTRFIHDPRHLIERPRKHGIFDQKSG